MKTMTEAAPIPKSASDLAAMRIAGRIVAETLALVSEAVRPGMTTADLDRLAYDHIRSRGAAPSFKGYNGFPASLCLSVNNEIVHGIPGPRVLNAGDLLSVDCGAFYRGFHADAATTVGVGQIPAAWEQMIAEGWKALERGIAQARPGKHVGDISAAIQHYLESHGYGAVADGLAGHGVGRKLHESPSVPNRGEPGDGPRLVPGVTLAIEPMYTEGRPDWIMLADGWTITTIDGSVAAHVEHTVAVTEDEPEILTRL